MREFFLFFLRLQPGFMLFRLISKCWFSPERQRELGRLFSEYAPNIYTSRRGSCPDQGPVRRGSQLQDFRDVIVGKLVFQVPCQEDETFHLMAEIRSFYFLSKSCG